MAVAAKAPKRLRRENPVDEVSVMDTARFIFLDHRVCGHAYVPPDALTLLHSFFGEPRLVSGVGGIAPDIGELLRKGITVGLNPTRCIKLTAY